MTWTYTSTDPSGTTRDQVRTYIGDTDTTDQLLTDEQIAFALTEGGTVSLAAAIAADWIAATFARKADKSVGDLSISYSQTAQQFSKLADRLRSESSRISLPYFGGISQSAKDTREADTDRVKPAFTVDMLDNPDVSAGTDESDADADAD